VVNVIIAFLLIKFIVYPGLGLVLGTTHPVVAVVSNSMHHDAGFETWWVSQAGFYEEQGITREDFYHFKMRNGFNKGDIIVLRGCSPKNLKVGDIIVFRSKRPDPIIHRIIKTWDEGSEQYFVTKGDNNQVSIQDSSLDETRIGRDQIIGRAALRVPFLGYIKIWFVGFVRLIFPGFLIG
ncbi:signal peptidase I, partial [Candidatus Woesearchaeota archaeon CG08_land_8_20_14_0_20_47_9]